MRSVGILADYQQGFATSAFLRGAEALDLVQRRFIQSQMFAKRCYVARLLEDYFRARILENADPRRARLLFRTNVVFDTLANPG